LAALTAVGATALGIAGLTASPASAAWSVRFVGGANCSDAGTGSAAQPFCTISAGVAVAGAGDIVLVSPGTYNEQITVPNSGTDWAPVTIESGTPGAAVITGGVHGFVVAGKSSVIIDGFTVTGTSGEGVYLVDSSKLVVSRTTVTGAGHRAQGQTAAGFHLTNVTSSLLSKDTSDDNSDSGFWLDGTTTGVTLLRNEASRNAQGWQRNANGVNVMAPANTLIGNLVHDNEDSGIQFYPGGDNGIATDNVTYHNGDHGIDDLNVTGGVLTGNTVYGNCTDGINVEGTSGRYTVTNNISMDNAVSATCAHGPAGKDGKGRAGDIGLYDNAPTGSVVDYNLVYQTTPGTKLYDWGTNLYTTLAAFQTGSGQGAHDIAASPQFLNVTAGDFHVREGSPAIDSANSSAPGEQWFDADGVLRRDDPNVANTGVGTRGYDDRGAYEFRAGPATAPTAALTATPATGTAPVQITADASTSTEGTAAIVDYTFDFGDGTVVDTHGTPKASHLYTIGGTYGVKVTVTDSINLTSTTTTSVTVAQSPVLVAALSVSPNSGVAPFTVSADAFGSAPGASAIAGYTFDFGDGTVAGPQTGQTAQHSYTNAGTYTVTATVADTGGTTAQATASVTVIQPRPPVATVSVTPATFTAPLGVMADASGSTAGTAPIVDYTFDFGDGTVAGPQTAAKAPHTYTNAGTYTVTVTVTDAATPTPATSQATTTVTATPHTGPIYYAGRPAGEALTVTNTGTTVPVTTPSAGGDALVVSLYLSSTTPGTVTATDSQGDVFTVVSDVFDTSKHHTVVLAAFNTHALGTGDTLTFTWPSASKHHIAVDEFAGITAVDQQATAAGPAGGTAFGVGPVTTPGTDELLFSAVGSANGTSPTFAAGWTPFLPVPLGTYMVSPAYRVVSATGSYSATGTTTAQWAASLVAFK
jgi:PKD repeat protein